MSGRLSLHPFSLKETLESGQFFRVTKVLDTYIVQSSDRIFSLWQQGDVLFYEGVEEPFLAHFFRLDEDLDRILKEVDQDSIIHQAIQKYRGLRLMRQDPWECLLSFLCSSAKAIPHIRCIVELLCKSSGKKVVWGNYFGYAFPEPEGIKTPLQLESVRAGFRTDYLLKVSRRIDRNQLLSLKDLSYEEARKRLMELPGVGKRLPIVLSSILWIFLRPFQSIPGSKRGYKRLILVEGE